MFLRRRFLVCVDVKQILLGEDVVTALRPVLFETTLNLLWILVVVIDLFGNIDFVHVPLPEFRICNFMFGISIPLDKR